MLRNLLLRVPRALKTSSTSISAPQTCQNGLKVDLGKSGAKNSFISLPPIRQFSITSSLHRRSDRLGEKSSRKLLGHGSGEGTEGEYSVNLDHLNR